MKRIFMAVAVMAAFLLTLTACTSSIHHNSATEANSKARQQSQQDNAEFKSPVVKNHLDYQNFYKSQELYDNPSTIIWCTTTWGNANSPLVTVPIAGKLTSSTVSLFPTQQVKEYTNSGTYNPELPSTDGMYHGSPPPYRYGFTPGGQYVEFDNMDAFCTTALTKFQRQSTTIQLDIDSKMSAAQKQAEKLLQQCNSGYNSDDASKNQASCQAAQQALQQGLGQ